MADLKDIRVQLDSLDNELVKLFLKRMSLSGEVAKIKIRDGLPLVHQGREDEIINRLTKDLNEDDAEYVKDLYVEIFNISRKKQSRMMEENNA